MDAIREFTVSPFLPERLQPLRRLAYNLWWSWSFEAVDLFRQLDEDLWEETNHNPALMLGTINQARLQVAAEDEAFLAYLQRVIEEFDRHVELPGSWFDRARHPFPEGTTIAFFSLEYGILDCLAMYSGGLGVLAGDCLKSASDLGVPMVAVGLLYQEGYFRQYLAADGWQQESYPIHDFYNLPLELERKEDGTPLTIEVDFPGRQVSAQIWRAQVGKVPLFLLDTNIPLNQPPDQDITDELYGGDGEMRIQQEVMLGIGGLRALRALGIEPTLCHMNEGHSALLVLEQIRCLVQEKGLSFAEAHELAGACNVFTTHTLVPAGIDKFPPALMEKYFGDYYRTMGLSQEEFLALGRQDPTAQTSPFNMAVLALKHASYTNGVSRLQAKIARGMWQGVWPGVPEEEVPIGVINNAIHPSTWVSEEMHQLLTRYLGPRWTRECSNPALWQRVTRIPDSELWRAHERQRERFVAFTRQRLRNRLEEQGASPSDILQATEVLNPEALTIGFARRFATYKRAGLILRDVERLARILSDEERPVQIIFAGKAHPQDNPAKGIIRQVVQLSRQEQFRRRVVFLEGYDMAVARYMVQGADLWLNTPRRPLEASGTSGMKAAVNAVLNLSVLDGWWAEAYVPQIGWAIGRGEEYEDPQIQDDVESGALYDLLEREIVPLFYDRGPDGLPRRWLARMKAAMQRICPFYNTNRMVRDYAVSLYLPAARHRQRLAAQDMASARSLAQWKAALREAWPDLRIESLEETVPPSLTVGDKLEVRARVHLGALTPEDVSVELYYGPLDPQRHITGGDTAAMACEESLGEGTHLFAGTLSSRTSGRYGYTLRILPRHPDLVRPSEPGLIHWA
jgi:starch phosphorylase